MHAHERIDPRRGPGRERDDGRREIDAGVAEYEEDREAERVDDYDSREDWDFAEVDDWGDDEEDSWRADAHDAHNFHEPFDDADISARVEDNRIVIEVLAPADTSPERWAEYVKALMRHIAVDFDGGHRIRSAEPTPEAL